MGEKSKRARTLPTCGVARGGGLGGGQAVAQRLVLLHLRVAAEVRGSSERIDRGLDRGLNKAN